MSATSPRPPAHEVSLLLNRLVLAAAAKERQQHIPVPDEDRFTDADLEKLEAQILALLPASPAAPEGETDEAREKGSRATAKRGTRKKHAKHDPEGEFSKQRQAGRAKAKGRGKAPAAAEATH